MSRSSHGAFSRWLQGAVPAIAVAIATGLPVTGGAIDLADQPIFGSSSPPGNVLLALSVEFPTATTAAYPSTSPYSTATIYLGYFNPEKCYRYSYQTPAKDSYFEPAGNATTDKDSPPLHSCKSSATAPLWSGNYLNWVSTQTLDAFRWVLTGGTRVVDTDLATILQKTRQKHTNPDPEDKKNFLPDRSIVENPSPAANGMASTPFNWGGVTANSYGLDTAIQFSGSQPDSCNFSASSIPHEVNVNCSIAGTTVSCKNTDDFPGVVNKAVDCPKPVPGSVPPLKCTATLNSSNRIDYACAYGIAGVPTCTASSTSVSMSGPFSTPPTSCKATTGTTPVVDYTNQSSAAGTAPANLVYRVYMQVKVCDPIAGLEDNCTKYGGHYKPEGLIQRYASRLRFSVFSYLNDSSLRRDGGVMRARMKFVGPTTPLPGLDSNGNPNTSANSHAEWDPVTGVGVANPDPVDAAAITTLDNRAATVVNSGVINYVNNFGRFVDGDYKTYDPVSELYYAGLRYLRGLPNVPEYSSLTSAPTTAAVDQYVDAFPVITKWDDPIISSCQKNFILGIGDVGTHADGNLNSSFLSDSAEPTTPPLVDADPFMSVSTSTKMVGQLEGYALNLSYQRPGNGSDNSFFIAGLAYTAHTTDIRPDLPGMQTVDTFWLDVQEKQEYLPKNQYWLAAKYGGFIIPSGFDPWAASNSATSLPITTWHNTADTIPYTSAPSGSDLRPDNYFGASRPDKMRDAMAAAFKKIEGATTYLLTSTATATTLPDVATVGSASYSATYDPTDWSGAVRGSTLTFAADNSVTATLQWDAAALLDAPTLLPGDRIIVTCCTKSKQGLPFRNAELSASTFISPSAYASLGKVTGAGPAQSAAEFINYLRGDHAKEAGKGGTYRRRMHRLGDIVNGRLNVVGPPSQPYFDVANPGYGSFRKSQRNRKTVAYVGANDGMLHAFDATMPGGGAELFAYVPGSAYDGSGGAAATGLASLGNPTFVHHYLVDARPRTFDVDFGRTPQATSPAVDWRTILVGGVGKGGKIYYALDVTDPSSWSSETAVAAKVLWEFSDSRLGFTFGDADVVRTKKWGWVVIVSSGYGNADGQAYFFFLDPRTGALLETVAVPGTAVPYDMGSQTAFLPDGSESLADSVYAGDMHGNLWRVDLTQATGNYGAVRLAIAADAAGDGQPIVVRPLVDVAPNSKKRYVFIGTGRLLGLSDLGSTSLQSFYAFVDGTGAAGGFASAPATPTRRKDLTAVTNLLAGLSTTAPSSALGWFFDLSSNGTGAVAERITVVPNANGGVVYGAIDQPAGVQCSASGTSRVFGLDFDTAKSVLADNNGSLVSTVSIGSNVIDLGLKTVGGSKRLIVGKEPGITVIPPPPKAPASLTRLNWRDVPTAD